jgi:hypothetical protein
MGGWGDPPSATSTSTLHARGDIARNLPAFPCSIPASLGKRATAANKLTTHTAIVLLVFDICASMPEGNDGAWIVTPRSPEPTSDYAANQKCPRRSNAWLRFQPNRKQPSRRERANICFVPETRNTIQRQGAPEHDGKRSHADRAPGAEYDGLVAGDLVSQSRQFFGRIRGMRCLRWHSNCSRRAAPSISINLGCACKTMQPLSACAANR